MSNSDAQDRKPKADQAEDNAFFPSPYSLSQYTSGTTDFGGADYPNAYKGDKWKILVVLTGERYLKLKNGEFFSTGNHPVETDLPMMHLEKAGFEFDITTMSGYSAKFEKWAFPKDDAAVNNFQGRYQEKFRNPRSLDEVWGNGFTAETPYIGVFIPGGHGVLTDVPFSPTVGKVLRWAHEHKRYLITLCHGPSCMLAADIDKPKGTEYIYKGREIVVFPDALDKGANLEMGYLPAPMAWLVGESLRAKGVITLNKGITGEVHRDGLVLTGDSPLASNNLGKLAATTILADPLLKA
ncbi:chaperone hchA [Purpureocillium lavendulum]|uniref:D-lactate dehydratase n=1 Tax=Purpureocillium lavendulum TaxID=1247861 RepID=A0AB34FPN2_9HYPO|nr:chaperone hchA [Purpureocillium lavendulum]